MEGSTPREHWLTLKLAGVVLDANQRGGWQRGAPRTTAHPAPHPETSGGEGLPPHTLLPLAHLEASGGGGLPPLGWYLTKISGGNGGAGGGSTPLPLGWCLMQISRGEGGLVEGSTPLPLAHPENANQRGWGGTSRKLAGVGGCHWGWCLMQISGAGGLAEGSTPHHRTPCTAPRNRRGRGVAAIGVVLNEN